ncbi:MAG: helix-turn-helix domain-containing protein [Erythrobacter sp.]
MALKAHLEDQAATPDQRRHPRRALQLETSGAFPDGALANVTVHNISVAGLLIETDRELVEGEVLAIALPGTGSVGAEIVWKSGALYGCAFEQALGEAALNATQRFAPANDSDGAALLGPEEPPAAFAMTGTEGFGPRLARLRRERGMTLAEVAAQLGVSKPTVWAWEKGKARPLPERIGAIAEALGVEVSTLTEVQGAAGDGGQVVEECRTRIATALGTESRNVRIMVEL